MFPKSILVAIIVLALVSMACGITVNVPVSEFKTGPTQTMPINIPVPSGGSANLTLEFGAGELRLAPGAVNALVDGTATYNVAELKPVITVSGQDVLVSTANFKLKGIPNIRTKDFENVWDLKLGSAPMALKINAGAYQSAIELGGLSLNNLEINDGAAEVKLTFSQPNLAEMKQFIYTTGASSVSLYNLANANFAAMNFRSGAGTYTLDFSGSLKRDASVTIESGVSTVKLIVPQGTPATVVFKGGLSSTNAHDGWQKSGNEYTNPGSGPALTITVTMGAGTLELTN
ncbi:MAG: hypothetical protein H6Q37_1681 [Chloroflexi bacterium]|nr:hypothetical protein [Chloroflexota bacterium]